MTVLFVVMPITLLFSAAFVAAYVWSARNGQLDDLETPPLRMLHDRSTAASNDEPSRPERETP
ncbi:MAG TPA: cbb3-type cytochrome oxidase assembly protein CcoS [Polyangiaceae bacterium]